MHRPNAFDFLHIATTLTLVLEGRMVVRLTYMLENCWQRHRDHPLGHWSAVLLQEIYTAAGVKGPVPPPSPGGIGKFHDASGGHFPALDGVVKSLAASIRGRMGARGQRGLTTAELSHLFSAVGR